MKSVLLSHPHAKPDAQGVAAGLEAAGILGAFYTGIAARRGSLAGRTIAWASRVAPRAANRFVEGVERSHLHASPLLEVGARTAANLVNKTLGRFVPDGRYGAGYLAALIHDAAVAARPWPAGIDGVYTYEDIALKTFRRARRKGLPCVYDLPTPHYTTVEQMWNSEAERWGDAIGAPPPCEPPCKRYHKDSELALATHVSVASRFTRQSLEAIGCELPIRVTPYGFPAASFACKEAMADGPFTAVAVGNLTLRKGVPYLLEAWKKAGLKDARLRLIGRMGLRAKFLGRYQGIFEYVPAMPRSEVAAEYRAADVLVFPTLGDGFGLVIQEAMCCGTPVMTTRCGGGPECIEHDREGWILPERDVDALVESLRQAASDRDRVYRMGQAARRRAESYTWKEAGREFAAFLAAI